MPGGFSFSPRSVDNTFVIVLRVLGLLLATGGCGAAAAACLRPLGLESRNARLLVFLLLFSAIQSLLILAAGLSGLLSFWPLTIVGVAGGALLLGQRPGGIHRPLALERSELVLVAVVGVALLSLLIKSFLLSPYTGDALQYHLPKIAEWIQAARFRWGPNHDPRVWFSGGFELIETWWVVFLHHDALIELGGLQMALIATAAVAVLAEAHEARPSLAALAYLFIPAVLLNATACGNDLAVAALTLSGYALVALEAPRSLQLFPLLLAVGVKATGGFAAVASWPTRRCGNGRVDRCRGRHPWRCSDQGCSSPASGTRGISWWPATPSIPSTAAMGNSLGARSRAASTSCLYRAPSRSWTCACSTATRTNR